MNRWASCSTGGSNQARKLPFAQPLAEVCNRPLPPEGLRPKLTFEARDANVGFSYPAGGGQLALTDANH